VLSVDFSHDGNLIAGCSAGEIGGATIWNISNGSILEFPIPVLAADVEFMPDGSTLAVATIWYESETQSLDSVLLWNFKEGALESVFPGEMATSLAVSDNGKLLAAAIDGHLRLWDILKAEEVEVQNGTLSEPVFRIDWSSQGIVAALNSDKSIVLWNENGEFIMHIANEAAEDFLLNSENNLIVSAFNKPLQIFTIPNSEKTFLDD
jgi:WD40 repeat protein